MVYGKGLTMESVLIIGIGDVLHGDDAFACHVVEALSKEPWAGPVQCVYLGNDPRRAVGLLFTADIAIIVGTLNVGETPGRLYSWSYSEFRRHLSWMAGEQVRVRFLAECLATAEMADELPKDCLFLWAQPQILMGYGMSGRLRRAVWETVRIIKRKLFRTGLLPEEALSVFPIVHIELQDAA
jgi:hydrogenase maturation protease